MVELIVGMLVGAALVVMLFGFLVNRALANILKKIDDQPQTEIETIIEEYSGQYFLYLAKTKKFLLQASSPSELVQGIHEKFPNQSVKVNCDDKAVLKRIEQELKGQL